MFPSDGGRREAWRCARECALWLCAAWLVVQNVVLFAILVSGGADRLWSSLLPTLGAAFAIMLPLWLVPVGAFLVALMARRAGFRRGHERPGGGKVTT